MPASLSAAPATTSSVETFLSASILLAANPSVFPRCWHHALEPLALFCITACMLFVICILCVDWLLLAAGAMQAGSRIASALLQFQARRTLQYLRRRPLMAAGGFVFVLCMFGCEAIRAAKRPAARFAVQVAEDGAGLGGGAWFPGDAAARIVSIDGSGGQALDIRPWTALFDLSLEASGEHWTGAADLLSVARFGHFTDERLPWETLRFASNTRRAAA